MEYVIDVQFIVMFVLIEFYIRRFNSRKHVSLSVEEISIYCVMRICV